MRAYLTAGPSRAHWVADSKVTHCAASGCGKLFDQRTRKHHCRRCGLIFCGEAAARTQDCSSSVVKLRLELKTRQRSVALRSVSLRCLLILGSLIPPPHTAVS